MAADGRVDQVADLIRTLDTVKLSVFDQQLLLYRSRFPVYRDRGVQIWNTQTNIAECHN